MSETMLEKREALYFNGFTRIDIEQSDFFRSLLKTLRPLNTSDLKVHEDFNASYPLTYDLKRDSDMSNMLIKLLFEQGIPSKLKKLTGRDYVLGDLVLRKSLQSKSYMPWHRDTYLDKTGNLVGRVPPLIKVIFSPQLEDATHHELSVLDGSSKRVFKSYILEKIQRFFFRETKFFQSNNAFVVFDSSIIHSAMSSHTKSDGSFRLIYNFCDRSQLDTFSAVSDVYNSYQAHERHHL